MRVEEASQKRRATSRKRRGGVVQASRRRRAGSENSSFGVVGDVFSMSGVELFLKSNISAILGHFVTSERQKPKSSSGVGFLV